MDNKTSDQSYTDRLLKLETPLWKRVLDVQAPYRWNLRRLQLGFTLDIGCGLGRNLEHLRGNGVGVDHNPYSVEVARQKGLRAFTTEDFKASEWCRENAFDAILVSHVMEHLERRDAPSLLKDYLPCLKKSGQVVVITPQERGYQSDPTHVHFMDFDAVRGIFSECGLVTYRQFSFPFPRYFGTIFTYNEFVSIGRPGGR